MRAIKFLTVVGSVNSARALKLSDKKRFIFLRPKAEREHRTLFDVDLIKPFSQQAPPPRLSLCSFICCPFKFPPVLVPHFLPSSPFLSACFCSPFFLSPFPPNPNLPFPPTRCCFSSCYHNPFLLSERGYRKKKKKKKRERERELKTSPAIPHFLHIQEEEDGDDAQRVLLASRGRRGDLSFPPYGCCNRVTHMRVCSADGTNSTDQHGKVGVRVWNWHFSFGHFSPLLCFPFLPPSCSFLANPVRSDIGRLFLPFLVILWQIRPG